MSNLSFYHSTLRLYLRGHSIYHLLLQPKPYLFISLNKKKKVVVEVILKENVPFHTVVLDKAREVYVVLKFFILCIRWQHLYLNICHHCVAVVLVYLSTGF